MLLLDKVDELLGELEQVNGAIINALGDRPKVLARSTSKHVVVNLRRLKTALREDERCKEFLGGVEV